MEAGMKRIIVILLVAALLVTGGVTFASNGKGAGQGCWGTDFGDFPNPGALGRHVRAVTGMNPAEASAFFGYTVGEVVRTYCAN
jgi:hypothetical protein